MEPWHLIVLALAVNQVVEIWHHSSLFARPRSALQLRAGDPDLLPTKLLEKPVEMLLCPWCFSVWVALTLYLAFFFAGGKTLICVLAIARGANMINDYIRAAQEFTHSLKARQA